MRLVWTGLLLLLLTGCSGRGQTKGAADGTQEMILTLDDAKAALVEYLEHDVRSRFPGPNADHIFSALTEKGSLAALKNDKAVLDGETYYLGGGWSCNLEKRTFGCVVLWDGSGYSFHGTFRLTSEKKWEAEIVDITFINGPPKNDK